LILPLHTFPDCWVCNKRFICLDLNAVFVDFLFLKPFLIVSIILIIHGLVISGHLFTILKIGCLILLYLINKDIAGFGQVYLLRLSPLVHLLFLLLLSWRYRLHSFIRRLTRLSSPCFLWLFILFILGLLRFE